MRAGRETSSSAFMSFASYREYHKTHVFCFYEGEDGKYYDRRIKNIISNDVIHIKANNKNNVLHVMKMIKEKNEYNGIDLMFFVDRDMDFNMNEYTDNDVYVTPCYSIENLYVNENAIGMILETEFGLNTLDEDYIKYKALFKKYYNEFCDLMLDFNTLVFLRKKKNINDVRVQDVKTSCLVNVDIENGVCKGEKFDDKINDLKQKMNVSDEELINARIELKKLGDSRQVFRGKNQFDFMIRYLELLCAGKDSYFKKKLTSVNLAQNNTRLSYYSTYADTPKCLLEFLDRHQKLTC